MQDTTHTPFSALASSDSPFSALVSSDSPFSALVSSDSPFSALVSSDDASRASAPSSEPYRRADAAAARYRLDANEGGRLADVDSRSFGSGETLRRYPDARPLEAEIARQFGLDPACVLVTAGADDGLLRACTAWLGPGRDAVMPTPTFEMLTRYVAVAGGDLRAVPELEGRLPCDELLAAIAASGERLGLVAVVTPNNPTGSVASLEDLTRLAAAAPRTTLLIDLAYAEYADEDPTRALLELDNVVVLRTFSKAWGLAGARVGFALGRPERIRALRAAGNPYPVSSASLAFAAERLGRDRAEVEAHVERVRGERERLTATLATLGARPLPSQANFVFARVPDPDWLCRVALDRGIALRRFPDRPGLERAVRIGCPDDPECLALLFEALESALAPEALLFDLDGVLADVSRSQVAAIQAAALAFDVVLDARQIAAVQADGDANCDWRLTQTLLARAGVEASLEAARDAYEAAYQGGLFERESLTVPRAALERAASMLPLGLVTGRPRRDAERFLERAGIAGCFSVIITREDAPLKPDPAPVRLALERLGARRAWMFGDTPDDMAAARAAGVVPVGVIAPGAPDPELQATRLLERGALRVILVPADLPSAIRDLLTPA